MDDAGLVRAGGGAAVGVDFGEYDLGLENVFAGDLVEEQVVIAELDAENVGPLVSTYTLPLK